MKLHFSSLRSLAETIHQWRREKRGRGRRRGTGVPGGNPLQWDSENSTYSQKFKPQWRLKPVLQHWRQVLAREAEVLLITTHIPETHTVFISRLWQYATAVLSPIEVSGITQQETATTGPNVSHSQSRCLTTRSQMWSATRRPSDFSTKKTKHDR